MDYRRIGGHIGGLRAGGYQLDLNSADVASITRTVSSFTRSIAMTGVGVGIGMLFLKALMGNRREDDYQDDVRMPLSGFVVIRNSKRQFVGVILNKSFHFESDGQRFEVPIDRVLQLESYYKLSDRKAEKLQKISSSMFRPIRWDTEISCQGNIVSFSELLNYQSFRSNLNGKPEAAENNLSRPAIKLIDNSTYCPVVIKDESIELLSVAGRQNLRMDSKQPFYIHGITVNNVKLLRERLQFAIKGTRPQAIKLLGKDVYKSYFLE